MFFSIDMYYGSNAFENRIVGKYTTWNDFTADFLSQTCKSINRLSQKHRWVRDSTLTVYKFDFNRMTTHLNHALFRFSVLLPTIQVE